MGLFDAFKKKEILEPLNVSDEDIVALADGQLIDVTTVSDPMFAEKMMGDSIAFTYTGDKVTICSPANGTLTAIFPTGHAFGVTMKNGVELLVHIGIDTVNAKGDGFRLLGRKQNDTVKAGDPIVEVDLKKLSKKYEMPVMLIITNANDQKIIFKGPQKVSRGDKVTE
ncbi:MAG: PTS glucose transporter subunit IIA [Solobacterium sp.]|nr:PTS glucose transporter subunit IIA [Solobacterium sp.]